MTYVVQTSPGGAQILYDLSARELRETKAKWEPKGFHFREVHFTYAHRWVRNGNPHGTDLWCDDFGRIRKATVSDD